uniref:procollagen-proline 4-dioxygenase n=2 Tax=Hirondellea gigas TaxID=1518452 RepID=A0A6A7FYS9_9CRUS
MQQPSGAAGVSVLLALLLTSAALGEVFTSTQDLQQVFLVERNLVDALAKYLIKAETRLGRIRRYLQEYEAVRTDMGWTSSPEDMAMSGNKAFIESDQHPDSTSNAYNNATLDSNSDFNPTESDSSSNNIDVVGASSETSSPDSFDEALLEKLAGNPLHTFHLMKRLTVYWKHIDAQVLQEEWNGVLRALFGDLGPQQPQYLLPADEDLQGAAQALVRLHHVYGLNMSSMVRGDIWGVQSSAELSAQDCLYMGKHSFNLGHYAQSVEWFSEAFNLAGFEHNQTISQDQVSEFLNTALKAHEEAQTQFQQQIQQEQEQRGYPDILTIENVAGSTENNENQWHTTLPHPSAITDLKDDLPNGFKYNSPNDDETNFFDLCRGNTLLTPEALSTLHCRYEHRGSKFLLLMPAKVEYHHPSPAGLVTFHDVLSDAETIAIKKLAHPVMVRAMVQGVEGKGNTVSSTRTSKVAWLDESLDPLMDRISRRIEQLTGLSMDQTREHSEMLQVANYGIGGHYNPHHDYLLVDKTPEELANINPREVLMGDRVATFMFYLSDVTRGGATAFPRMGVAVWPKRGSAAFWFNLRRSGAANDHTLHGACPVVHGSKWVSNKWIRERGQFNTRPCSLNPRE